jgi:hypothetical protein
MLRLSGQHSRRQLLLYQSLATIHVGQRMLRSAILIRVRHPRPAIFRKAKLTFLTCPVVQGSDVFAPKFTGAGPSAEPLELGASKLIDGNPNLTLQVTCSRTQRVSFSTIPRPKSLADSTGSNSSPTDRKTGHDQARTELPSG